MADDRPTLKYMFSMDSGVDARPVGEAPAGYRMDLAYQNGEARTRADSYHRDWLAGLDLGAIKPPATVDLTSYEGVQRARKGDRDVRSETPAEAFLQKLQSDCQLEWFGFEGQFLSGGDWSLVRKDGVSQFSGRVTLKSKDPGGAVVDASLSGMVDLRLRRTDGGKNTYKYTHAIDRGNEVYNAWRDGLLDSDGKDVVTIPVSLCAAFEAAQGQAASWAPKKLRNQTEGAWKLTRLLRGQFVAIGEATLGKGRLSQMQKVRLDVFEVMPVPPGKGQA